MRSYTFGFGLLVAIMYIAISPLWAERPPESPTTLAHLSSRMMFVAKLDGQSVVPPVMTSAKGLVLAFVNFASDSVLIEGTITGLSSAVTGIHIHRGLRGQNGDVVLDLSTALQGNLIVKFQRLSMLDPALLEAALRGELYIAVHTANNPNGELRGQLMLETDWQLAARLDGQQQVPSVEVDAQGYLVASLRQDGKRLRLWGILNGLSSSIVGVHLHQGARGQNGDVLADLSGMVQGSSIISGEIDCSSFASLLTSGQVYINVHTQNNPNGEIRGQLELNPTVSFDVWLSGMQQVPDVMTNARGVGRLWLSTRLDTLYYELYTAGLSSAITGVHLHQGAPGTNGDVLLDFSSGVQADGWILGSVTSSSTPPLTAAVVQAMLRGETYVNVHTANYPNGEIRSQVHKLVREGLRVGLDGKKQVPPVVTVARGTGVISIDRDQTNAHFAFALNGVAPQAVHFHKGARGENGDVLFDLSPYFQAAAMAGATAEGYWTAESDPAFTQAIAMLFIRDSVYVNVHTMMYPNGEIRGQATRDYEPAALVSTVTEQNDNTASLLLSPNPVATALTVQGIESQSARWTIYDLQSRTVLSGTSHPTAGSISLDVELLPPGMYILRCMPESGAIRSAVFIKQ